VLEGNEASIKLLKNVGCTQEGVHRQVIYTKGQYLDVILFGLTKDEFIEMQKEEGTSETS
jgi:RimJ/RimL family protein N-acetyltransferase